MIQWHSALQRFDEVEASVRWLSVVLENGFISVDDEINEINSSTVALLSTYLQASDVTRAQNSLMAFCGKSQLDDFCMSAGLQILARLCDVRPVPVFASSMPVTTGSATMLPDSGVFAPPHKCHHVIAIHISELEHWAGAVVDLHGDEPTAYIIEPYQACTGQVKSHLQELLKPFLHGKHLIVHVLEDIVQTDGYNCGILSLMAMEIHVRMLNPTRYSSRAAAAYFRVRYLAHVVYSIRRAQITVHNTCFLSPECPLVLLNKFVGIAPQTADHINRLGDAATCSATADHDRTPR
jgi:hypothetical protein